MKLFKRGIETLRQPDRNPRCYELTHAERLQKLKELSYLNKTSNIKENKQC